MPQEFSGLRCRLVHVLRLAEAKRMEWELTIVREDAVSAATVAKRPLMLQALADLKAKRYDGLAVSKLAKVSGRHPRCSPSSNRGLPRESTSNHLRSGSN